MNRRSFLKMATGAGAAVALAPLADVLGDPVRALAVDHEAGQDTTAIVIRPLAGPEMRAVFFLNARQVGMTRLHQAMLEYRAMDVVAQQARLHRLLEPDPGVDATKGFRVVLG